MSGQLPDKDIIQDRAVHGLPVTNDEVSHIASAESELTGTGPIKGGKAATAQSVHDKQQNFLEKAGDVARKPAEQITKEDAAEVQKAEARLIGGQPEKGSMSANLQSAADKNQQ
ncbi:uncharacterized protein F5Z01DRAFT_80885 [Emericellopsis atlantica]|uniref:SMP domain-containing protein n=1 Tax=Emericellopsis atlantica TaxID=2614577 RepID=A0A9P7ZM67_9HYPO|nr:uncharacterized protein F5Z01DRAFT_80885 [Emericellopsis atlantica]KAG9254590.1 hypothetical protein F5Z01DRAFT_80885 [Emericellopsis atlantica]